MGRALLAWLIAVPAVWGAGVADVARSIREAGLDAGECYRVRELTLAREDIRLYFNEGYLTFGTPAAGERIAAVFTSDVEGGDGEVLLMPPSRGERRSLASYTGSPNLNEHFTAAVLFFSDGTYGELMEQIRGNPSHRKVPEMGVAVAGQWSGVVRNLAASFESRLALDLLSGAPGGFFTATLSGRTLGNFDVLYDPRLPEQVMAGQVATRDARAYFDVWTSFEARSYRNRSRQAAAEFTLRDYRIDATLAPDLALRAVARVRLIPAPGSSRVLPFDLAHGVRIESALVDGRPADVLQRESLRANLVANSGNELVLVVPPEPLDAGREYEMEFRFEGRVVHDAGNQVYYVRARANWYPNRRLQFATYDLAFRYPKEFDLVAPGRVVEDKTEGEWRVTRRRTDRPIRVAGFNLGHYDRAKASRGSYTAEVCANRSLEQALQAKIRPPLVVLPPAHPWPRRQRPPEVVTLPPEPPPPSPAARLQELASEVAGALEFMGAHFGPAALDTVTVSPVPGTFGQGFPGMIYLSTLSYLAPESSPVARLARGQRFFFGEVLQAHETAHQWWGNVITSAGYHDDWLMEALANYSALMYIEKRKGARAIEAALEDYRTALLAAGASGGTVESAGPIVLGPRLESSQNPQAWRSIIYGKGSWVLHMLRRRTGDARFLELLAELRRRHEWKSVSTDQFRTLAARFLPPRSPDPDLSGFFDYWVYGTGIPDLRLKHSVKTKGRALVLEGVVEQGEVEEDFSAVVPVEIQFRRGRPVIALVETGGGPATFSVPLRERPARVLLDPGRAVLRR